MSGALISVIVPIYKVEQYLDRCVSSITGQTYTDLEIILVDDGSPDGCPAMCDKWAEKDSRIKVVHKENGGLSDARNAGLAVATGEYVSFIDSDDWIDENFYSVLYSAAIINECDVAECDFVKTSGDIPAERGSGRGVLCDTAEAMKSHLEDKMFRQVVWNKLYRRSVITAEFDKGKYHEDIFWTYKIIANCERLVHVEMPLYRYFQRNDSIMGSRYSLKRLDAVKARVQRLAFIKENFTELYDYTLYELLLCCIMHGQAALKSLEKAERKEAILFLKGILKKYKISSKYRRTLPITHNVWITAARISFVLVCKVRSALKLGV